MSAVEEEEIRKWLDDVWAQTEWVEVLRGGDDVPLFQRQSLAPVEDPKLLDRIHKLTMFGSFAGDICRCPGDLTLALFEAQGSIIGSATLHPGRISWERSKFQNDLISLNPSALRLTLSLVGIEGASRGVLHQMIQVLGLHEGDVQFRPAGDSAALAKNRVPPSLAEDLLQWSGGESASLSQQVVVQLTGQLCKVEGDSGRAVWQLLAWLGSTTWPAEAMAGDGQLARRMLGELDPALILEVLPKLSDSAGIMGAVAWAAFNGNDADAMSALEPAVTRLLSGRV